MAGLIPLKQISTSLLERLNGMVRQHVAPTHRKTRSFAKCRTAIDTQTQLFNIKAPQLGPPTFCQFVNRVDIAM